MLHFNKIETFSFLSLIDNPYKYTYYSQCYLDVVFVWSVCGLDSAKNVSLACESSLYHDHSEFCYGYNTVV
jgi:hypothetical protein